MGWAFAAFNWAYALFEVPGGWLGDRIGPRRVLTRVVLWWSFFTAGTGLVWSSTSLIVTRALFGAGEAGCFPNLTRIFTTWLPVSARERAQGTLWFAARWSGAFTPLLVAYVLETMTWRHAFMVFGVPGLLWSIAFYIWFRDDPRQHPFVNAAEIALLPPAEHTAVAVAVPWDRLLASRSVWLLSIHTVPVLRLVLLRDLAPDLPARSTRHQREVRRAAGVAAAAARRHRMPGQRLHSSRAWPAPSAA